MTVVEATNAGVADTVAEQLPTIYSTTTAGWRTVGHDWRFRGITATVTIPKCGPGDLWPDATIGLQGFSENPYGLTIGVMPDRGSGATAYYGYDIGASKEDGVTFKDREGYDLVFHAGDVVKMEIFHNHDPAQEEFKVTKAPGMQNEKVAYATVIIPDDYLDKVFYRHAGWNCYIDGPNAVLPKETTLWEYRDCSVKSEGVHGAFEDGIFGLWDTEREIVTRGGPTADVVMSPDLSKDNHTFEMTLNPGKHPVAVIYSTTTAGWRTYGHNWRFKSVTATVTIPKCGPGDPCPGATIGLQGFSENPYGLAVAVMPDRGSGATAYYGYDIGASKEDRVMFKDPDFPDQDLVFHAGDVVKMEIFHNHDGHCEEFKVTKAPGTQNEKVAYATVTIPDAYTDKVFYRHAGWNCYIDGPNTSLPPEDRRLWLYRDCHTTSEGVHGTIAGDIFGPWRVEREIITHTGGPTGHVVMFPGWPWPQDNRVNFGMKLHGAVPPE